ncbi:ribose-5-phosphate isomerase RpiA [Virgibacillus flavescens]|uniref:ribose-5-phosphate isomerase RpiA n=1 Tax=Virgibacillus flavescens TaxID=1611422 RepID=UPI003D327BC2
MQENKRLAAEKAVDFVEDHMILGLGSGSTVYWFLKKLGERVSNGLQIKGIPTSKRTEGWAKEFGIPLTDFSKIEIINLAIDGTDEIDHNLNLVKGGGGSLVREKIVDAYADQLIIIADESKVVNALGSFPLPVEILPFGWEVTVDCISRLGFKLKLRMDEDHVFVSDNGNYIVDCQFDQILNPKDLHTRLKLLVGVVETGLFIDLADKAIIGRQEKIEILT